MESLLQYFLTREFQINLLWLLGFSAIVTLVVCLIRGFFRNNKGEGLFPYIVIFFVLAAPGYLLVKTLYNTATSKSMGDMAFVAKSVNDRKYGPVCVLRQDKVRLFEHYQDLIRRKKSCEEYKSKLDKEQNSLSDSNAKKVLDKEITFTNSELKILDAALNSIEDLACKVYFSRFMSNLGANISSVELNGEMDRLIIRAAAISRELEKSESTNPRLRHD